MCIVFVLMNGVTPRATRTDTLFHYPTCFRSPAGTAPRRDTRVIGLIGVAHAGSHFYQLVLPPLFPLLKDDFGVGYAELGLLMALFYGTSGRSEEHTSELQSLMRISYAVFCLKKKPQANTSTRPATPMIV